MELPLRPSRSADRPCLPSEWHGRSCDACRCRGLLRSRVCLRDRSLEQRPIQQLAYHGSFLRSCRPVRTRRSVSRPISAFLTPGNGMSQSKGRRAASGFFRPRGSVRRAAIFCAVKAISRLSRGFQASCWAPAMALQIIKPFRRTCVADRRSGSVGSRLTAGLIPSITDPGMRVPTW